MGLLLLLRLSALLLQLAVEVGVDENDITLGYVVLQVGDKFRAVGQFDALRPYGAAVLQYADCLHIEFYVRHFAPDIDVVYRH